MIQILMEYRELRKKLTFNVGCEESIDEVIWNEGVMVAIEELLKDVDVDVRKMIVLNLI